MKLNEFDGEGNLHPYLCCDTPKAAPPFDKPKVIELTVDNTLFDKIIP